MTSRRKRKEQHMREVFQQELENVQNGLVHSADLVLESITNAVNAFTNTEIGLAETVISADPEIDRSVLELDEQAIQILARQQPVARDLRIVVSALRISASLERMGDIAEHIAQLARYRYPDKAIPKGLRPVFKQMGALDIAMAQKVRDLLDTYDEKLVEEIFDMEAKLDELHLAVFDKVLSEAWAGEVLATVDATLASRYHERFGDHAVSIAKKVQYLSTGNWNA